MSRRRKMSKAQGGIITLLITVLLAIVGIFSSLAGADQSGESSTTATSVVNTPFQPDNPPVATDSSQVPQPPPAEEWWRVYFTDPLTINDPANYSNSIEQRLIEFINVSQVSIHIAAFEFDLDPVADALIAAHNRGVDVRWVTDNEFGLDADTEPGGGQFAKLQNAVRVS